jgi:3-oxoacyl-[acyl-carrier-protein] synthase-3
VRTSNLFIGSLGVYIPPAVTVEWAVGHGLYPQEYVELHELGGVAVAGDIPAPEMALCAAEQAMNRWGGKAPELDLLLYASSWHQGPDGWLPHSYLQRHLTIGNVLAVEIRQGCNGMFSALELAASYLAAVPARTSALLVAADNYGTPLIDRWRSGPTWICGDAGSALILTKRDGFARLLSVCTVTVTEGEEYFRGAEALFPPSVTVGRSLDYTARFQQSSKQGSTMAAMNTVPERMTALMDQALTEADIKATDLARVASPNFSREIVQQSYLALLGLPMSRSSWDFGRTIGHCGASDQVLSFEHFVDNGELAPGQHMMFAGMAPGCGLSCAVVQILTAPAWASRTVSSGQEHGTTRVSR